MNCSIASLFALIALLSNAGAWIARPSSLARNTRKISLMTRCAAAENEIEMDGNPCWEDIYDDDCTMSNVFGASFVAADWIKTMPCAQGIEDCDMPDDLKVPETRPEAGIDHVDVMGMLGLKRAESIDQDLAP